MAEGFGDRSQPRPLVGTPADKWIVKILPGLPVNKLNGELVMAKNKLGMEQEVCLGRCGLLFTKLRTQREENVNNHGGNAACVVGVSSEIVDFGESFEAMLLKKPHSVSHSGNVCAVPLFHSNPGSDVSAGSAGDTSQTTVMKQCAAQWQGGGNPYKVDSTPDNNHAALMYMYSIQSLVWEIATEQSKQKVHGLAEKLVLLVRAAKAYFVSDPVAFKTVQALEDADDALDMLNRSLAFVFFDHFWDTETFLRIVEVSLKRWAKHYSPDFVSHPALGINCICLMVSPLRDLVRGKSSVAQCCDTINTRTLGLAQLMQDYITERGHTLNKRILGYLCAEFPVEQTGRLYDYCIQQCNADLLAPLVSMGLLPEVEMPFKSTVSGTVNGHHTKVTSKFRPLSEGKLILTSTLASEWTPLALKSYGVYHFEPTLVGAARAGTGNTLGDTNVAVVRFTSGYDVLPNKVSGISSAGMFYTSSFDRNGVCKWMYSSIHKSLSLAKPFTVNLTEREVTISQRGEMWFSMHHNFANLETNPLMVGFKFLRFVVSFTAPNAPLGEDATGTALIQRLAGIKVN